MIILHLMIQSHIFCEPERTKEERQVLLVTTGFTDFSNSDCVLPSNIAAASKYCFLYPFTLLLLCLTLYGYFYMSHKS